MITLTVDRDQDGRIAHFILTGHADSGPYGYDLVCAGVSAVAFGALNAVESLAETEMNIRDSEKGGFLECTLPGPSSPGNLEKAQLILEAMLVSMRTIEQSYGKYIKIIDKGGGNHAEA